MIATQVRLKLHPEDLFEACFKRLLLPLRLLLGGVTLQATLNGQPSVVALVSLESDPAAGPVCRVSLRRRRISPIVVASVESINE